MELLKILTSFCLRSSNEQRYIENTFFFQRKFSGEQESQFSFGLFHFLKIIRLGEMKKKLMTDLIWIPFRSKACFISANELSNGPQFWVQMLLSSFCLMILFSFSTSAVKFRIISSEEDKKNIRLNIKFKKPKLNKPFSSWTSGSMLFCVSFSSFVIFPWNFLACRAKLYIENDDLPVESFWYRDKVVSRGHLGHIILQRGPETPPSNATFVAFISVQY